ncbi:hypothetical protein TNCV_4294141 [Trichonephila clavipes]|uniref:Uncharacterized protein n=1 Tax=Trichonephila clavipes TaxID=2585209 RepID=A0A8X6RKQ5_TRICX|nr:hypothetical protein TNCV_4294141 [Trichonephila clavipes]
MGCGFLKRLIYNITYNLKKKPPPQPLIKITTMEEFYIYLEAEKKRYERAKRNNQRLNRDRALFGLKKKPFYFDFR